MKEEIPIIRQNISSAARFIREHGLPKQPLESEDPLLQKYEISSKEAIEVWNHHKVEHNILASILVAEVVNKALEDKKNFPPFGLVGMLGRRVKKFGKEKPYVELRNHMHRTLKRALISKTHEWESSKQSNTVLSVYKRFKQICEFRNKFVAQRARVKEVMIDAMRSSSEQMASFLELIPKVYMQEIRDETPSVEELIEIAKNSYTTLQEFAAQHIEIFIQRRNEMGSNNSSSFVFDPKAFTMHMTREGFRVELAESAKEYFKERVFMLPGKYEFSREATGCPALVSFEGPGSSAIRKLWDWNLEIAKRIYEQQFA